MKKLAVILLALVLLLSLTVPAFAAGTATISVTDDRTYEVYQIFTGDLADGTLSNIKWGKNGKLPSGANIGDAVAADTLATLGGISSTSSDTDKLDAILPYVDLNTEKLGTVSGEKTLSATTGYYLLKDVTPDLAEGAEHSAFIVTLIRSTAISPKASTVTAEKKVMDKNDSTGTASDWQDSADYDIGDDVPFRLTGTVSDKLDAYETYYFCFHDTLSAGLQLNQDSITVKIGETTISASAYAVNTAPSHEGCSFEIKFTNLKQVSGVTAGCTITVEYTAKLTERAVIGGSGNPNTLTLEYSNDPNADSSTGTTTTDKVVVFTYEVDLTKVDGSTGKPLDGAGFTLYKKDSNGTWNAVGEEIKGTSSHEFTWAGVDDGTYKLVETTTPPGYNTMADLEFTITAEHSVESADPKLTKLDGGKLGTGSTETGIIASEIENNRGTVLPETGASGTALFWGFGSLLTLAAVIFLVVRKKMSVYED